MAIRIKSKTNGFRRCGRAWPDQWTDVTEGSFTPDQLETLKAEPQLWVEEYTPELKLEGDDSTPKGGDPKEPTNRELAEQILALGGEVPGGNPTKATLKEILAKLAPAPAPTQDNSPGGKD